MYAISDWYAAVGEFSFPTLFLLLDAADRAALLANEPDSAAGKKLLQRLGHAMETLPGASIVNADCCAPTDSPAFNASPAVTSPTKAWELLVSSAKVRTALQNGASQRLIVRPARRMDRTREFRLFIRDRVLVGMSQYCLERHFARLAKRDQEFWEIAVAFATAVLPRLPVASTAMDVYLTSKREMMIIDLNPWGAPTDPLLYRDWDRDWSKPGIRLIPPPTKMGGDVSVSF